MLLFKKNIWLLFYIIVFIGSALLANAIYVLHKDILTETKNTQRYLTKIYHDRLDALLTKHETIHNLVENDYVNNPNFNIKKIRHLLELNPLLLDIWIFSTDGELLLSALPDMALPNLLQNQNTRQWFQETLKADQMVIGKAYLLKSINKWILPIRKKIIDNKGNILAVISTGIDLTKLHNQWNEEDNHNNTIIVTLNNGAFRIVDSNKKIQDYRDYYNKAQTSYHSYSTSYSTSYGTNYRGERFQQLVNGSLAKQSSKQLQAHFSPENNFNSASFIQGTDYQNIRATRTHIYKRKSSKVLYTLARNKRYSFFISAEMPYQLMLQKFFENCFFYSFYYLLLIIIVFILFRWIDRIEKSKIAELAHKAEHDALTGLANHTVINKHFAKIQKHKQTPFALLYLNLDNFNNINKAFGHRFGHLILIEAAKRISQSLAPCKEHSAEKHERCRRMERPCLVRSHTLATRYSGDEFVIFVESDNKDEIAECAKLLLKNIAQPYVINKNEFNISASIGIARFPEDSLEIETLLSYANSSINLAEKRKNQYQFFSKSDHCRFTRNIEIEQALRHAIENKEISLVYQPQLDREQKIFGVEALVRWNSEKLGFVAPDEFITVAEKAGYMPQLGLYIMHQAMQEIAKLKKQEGLAFKLAINASAKQFMQGNFMKKLLEACTFHAIDPATITIEITESLFIESLDRLLPIFNEMKEHNISLSLDDFGTGYSSLNMLRKVPIDELKIDKSFVDHITDNQSDKEMIKSIIGMGKNLGMSVLAEGVETKAHLEILENSGCDIFQGYYFSRPLPLNELHLFIRQQEKNSCRKIV